MQNEQLKSAARMQKRVIVTRFLSLVALPIRNSAAGMKNRYIPSYSLYQKTW